MIMLKMFQQITNTGLSPDGFYLLLSLYYKEIPSGINIELCLKILESKGYIKERKLTVKGSDLVKEFVSKYKLDDTGRIKIKASFNEEDKNKVNEYRELFPKGTLPSGQPARATSKELEKKFLWFFLNYKYDWDTILKATKKYIRDYEPAGYKYMKTSSYFINKTDKGVVTSTLASYCDMILDGDDSVIPTYSSHDVL